MTARRNSARLAMAVSSILAAPALVTGLGLVAGLAVAPEARAQETTAALSGYVVDAAGNPLVGAQVTILHASSGTSMTVATNAAGQFIGTGLRVGGPYTVSAATEGYQGAAMDNVYIELGRRSTLTLSMYPTAQLAEVEITAASERATAVGVGTEFSAQQIAELPSINRDIKSAVRIDPKAWIDPTNSDAMEIAGVNNRYNTITVDGVRQSDDFGLNNNGYPTQRSPISIDAIEAVSLLTAPFDVQYSAFRGSTINIVTKSGTNEFNGSAFYYKYDDSLVGNKSKASNYTFTFDQETYGASIGGPIIKDKLFFFASYEKLDKMAPQDFGPTGSGFAVEIPGVLQTEVDQIATIADTVYGFDIGTATQILPEADEKILGKIDWNLNDNHRASLAYQRTEGNEVITQNMSTSFRSVGTPSNWYNRAITMESKSFQLFSNWNDRFATEVKLARKNVETLQESLMGSDFAQMRIRVPSGGEVFLGPDISRHANYLTNDLDQMKLKGEVFLGDHTLTFGFEKEKLDIFNLFVQRSEGEYYFNSITDFQNRRASRLDYNNSFTNDENDAAANFGYTTNSVYLQDKWQITEDFQLQYGVRFDKWSSDDVPLLNQNFQTRHGFSNQFTLDGRDLMMPRLGFNWQVADRTLVRGGFGLFGGGTPNVWISNSYSNDGVTVVFQRIDRPTTGPNAGIEPRLDNVDGYNINATVLAAHGALRGDGNVNAVRPDFEIPSQWRFNLGVEHTFENDWKLTSDVMYSTVKDEVLWQDVRLRQTATAPDGRPIYTREGTRSSSIQDLVLGNTDQGRALVFTVDVSKAWVTSAGIMDLFVGYGHQDVLDVNPGTSSTASSNWDNLATEDPNNPKLSTSNYELEHRFTLAFNWRKDFFEDLFTSAGLYVERRSGRPYSYTFGGGSYNFGDPRQGSRQRHLFYVPSGPTDVIYEVLCTSADVSGGVTGCATTSSVNAARSTTFGQDVEAYIAANGLEAYRGQIAPRNAFNSPWTTIVDLRLAQEIPTFFKGTRGVLTLDIENLTNLINSDWGRFEQVGFPFVAPVLDAAINPTTNKYVYRPVSGASEPRDPFRTLYNPASFWRIQLGVRFEF